MRAESIANYTHARSLSPPAGTNGATFLSVTGKVKSRAAHSVLSFALAVRQHKPVAAVWKGSRLCDADLLDLAEALGGATSSKRNPEPIRSIVPVDVKNAPPNTLSSRHGLGAFPFHTDGAHWRVPPRYLLLYCEDAGRTRRPTLLLTAKVLLAGHLRALLLNEIWTVSDGRRAFLTRAASRTASTLRLDVACMRATSRFSSTRLQEEIEQSPRWQVEWADGQLLLIDNRRCLHARSGPSNQDGRERVLKRILVGGSP